MTPEQACLASRLRIFDGATAEEAVIVIDLAYNPHQPRDSHGRFASRGGAKAEHEQIFLAAKAMASAEARAYTDKQMAALQKQHKAEMSKLIGQVRKANQYVTQTAEVKGSKRRRKALALHTATVVAGGLLAIAEAKLGVSELGQLATAMGPTIAHDLVDWAKRFSG